ncbi:MAG: hypothetical protein OXM02_00700 [Bacteroidota bacterium]|nr:hypothetical protein [Bacteroidota bacterium]MDE2833023.1 hypothetical protein [Bacteroidota bacterium]MDE2956210.1 hypothetical protein [Bacteroidota bacterium]
MAKKKHILLARAHVYERRDVDLRPPNCDYDLLVGAWIYRPTGRLLVESAEIQPPRTKKADVETGEDQKGY